MTNTEFNSITVLTYLKIICLHIIYKEKACLRFRRSRTKGVNAHARSCVRKRQFTFRFYGGRRARTIVFISSLIIHLILFGRSDASQRTLFGIRFAWRCIQTDFSRDHCSSSLRVRTKRETLPLVTVSCLLYTLLHK